MTVWIPGEPTPRGRRDIQARYSASAAHADLIVGILAHPEDGSRRSALADMLEDAVDERALLLRIPGSWARAHCSTDLVWCTEAGSAVFDLLALPKNRSGYPDFPRCRSVQVWCTVNGLATWRFHRIGFTTDHGAVDVASNGLSTPCKRPGDTVLPGVGWCCSRCARARAYIDRDQQPL